MQLTIAQLCKSEESELVDSYLLLEHNSTGAFVVAVPDTDLQGSDFPISEYEQVKDVDASYTLIPLDDYNSKFKKQ